MDLLESKILQVSKISWSATHTVIEFLFSSMSHQYVYKVKDEARRFDLTRSGTAGQFDCYSIGEIRVRSFEFRLKRLVFMLVFMLSQTQTAHIPNSANYSDCRPSIFLKAIGLVVRFSVGR